MSDTTVVGPIDNIVRTSDALPEGWAEATLKECSTLITKGTTPTTYGFEYQRSGIPFVRVENLSNGQIDPASITAFIETQADEALRRSRLKSGDLLFSIAGTIGRTALVRASDVPANTNQAVAIIRGTQSVFLHQFLLFALTSIATQQQANDEARGGAMNNISLSDVRSLRLSIPPLCEQKRIITKVGELFSPVNSARDHLTRVPAILERFRQAVLAAACSGKLTEDWRAEHPAIESGRTLVERIRQSHVAQGLGHGGQAATPTEDVHNVTQDAVPDMWAIEELKVLCQPGRSITYGILKPGPDVSGGVPYIRVADFPNNRLKLEGIRRTTKQIADMYRRSALREGDLLLSIRGTAGRVCRVPAQLDGANITQDTARISIHLELSADYIEFYLQSPSAQMRLEAAMKGVAVRGVNIGDVRVLQVALPPRVEQDEIVRRVDVLLKIAEAIEQRLLKATARADKLTQSILAKAFRGELVLTEAELARREGREYEPASVLLEKIRTETESQQKSSLCRKRNVKKGIH